jgi:purine-binding chemotaxis protein CheW
MVSNLTIDDYEKISEHVRNMTNDNKLSEDSSLDALWEGGSTGNGRKLVICSLIGEEFGVDINKVTEIIKYDQITPVPNSESFIIGVINLRGRIIVVVDLSMRLGFGAKEINDKTRVVVIDENGLVFGVVVDTATEVLSVDDGLMGNVPSVITRKINADFIEGVSVVGSRIITVLDMYKLFNLEEFVNKKGE